jgi:hypothetical protein
MNQDPSKTQTLLLIEAVKDLKKVNEDVEMRLRIVERTAAETKVYFTNMMDSMDELKDSIEDLKENASETKGTFKGFAIAASLGGGIGAALTKLLTGGGH